MPLSHLLYWYQKKIGTYDKQQWEKTVERQIFGGFTDVPMRTAKLKTELIDVDLVRGSSFPKAKPKHGLCTVVWLATRRLLFLPLYRRWWVQQTSPRTFALFLLLYSLQLFNVCTYFGVVDLEESYIVSPAEVLMPVGMMFVLCMVHSQIVSTNSGPATTSANPRSRIRRSRYERCRTGKLRTRRHLRTNGDGKCSRESNKDRGNKVRNDLSPSVRFAKRVSVSDNTPGVPAAEPEVELMSCPLIEDDSSRGKEISTTESTQPEESPISPANQEPAGDVAAVNLPEAAVVHQDDDGFESLNGNVSSDNDRTNARAREVIRNEAQRDTGSSDIFEERTSAARGVENDEKITMSEWRSNKVSIGISKITVMDSERRANGCDSPEVREDPGRIATSREGKRQCESEEEGECDEATINHLTEATTSATEWMGVTSNSDVCDYSSDLEESDGHSETNSIYPDFVEHPFFWDLESPPSILLGSSCTSSDRVSCTIWTRRDIKKAELSVLDISSAIIARVESMPEDMDYFYGGLLLSLVLTLIPSMKRISDEFGGETINNRTVATLSNSVVDEFTGDTLEAWSEHLCNLIDVAFGSTLWERSVVLTLAFEKLSLSCLLFFLLAVAERTFKQRLLYAKLFSHLTSSRRARKSDLPHFRLNKVRNIKTWLSVRSYLKRRGPQRSVDVIVSAVFIVTLLLLSFVSLELIRDLENLHSRYNVEALLWSFALGIYILRFMTLGTKIQKKYKNLSILITEQINLYLQIEQKPHKKDELMVANSVLKLAADLIKELESPFKISGLSANPYLYTITKVVLLSALSGVLSELLGFKLKLHKITIK